MTTTIEEVGRALGMTLCERVGPVTHGGCDSCDAVFQMVKLADGIYQACVFHDDECPFLAAEEGR